MTTSSNNNDDEFVSIWQKIIFSFIMITIIFFSITGNILVIIAISKYSYLKITNNIFLFSLAVADLFVAITAMSLYAFQFIFEQWYLKAFMCRMWFFCDILFSTSSTLNLFCVSLDRYLSISDEYTFYYTAEHPTKSWRVRMMISLTWFVSACLASVVFTDYFADSTEIAKIADLDFNYGRCEFKVNLIYRYISACFTFWIPTVGVIVFYLLVMKKANKMERSKMKVYSSLHAQLHTNNQLNAHTRNSSARSSGEVIWKRKYKVNYYYLIN